MPTPQDVLRVDCVKRHSGNSVFSRQGIEIMEVASQQRQERSVQTCGSTLEPCRTCCLADHLALMGPSWQLDTSAWTRPGLCDVGLGLSA